MLLAQRVTESKYQNRHHSAQKSLIKRLQNHHIPLKPTCLESTLIYWRVSANGEKPSAWSAPFSFTSANPPPIPSLIAPLDNAYFSNYTPKFDWNDPINTDHYQVQIASSNSFSSSSLIFDATTQPPYSSFIPPTPLTPNRTYYWRVRAFGATGEYSLWSSVRHFHTRLPAPVLLYPVNEGMAPAISTFDWEDVPEATGYGIQVSTSSSFSTFVAVNRTVLDFFLFIQSESGQEVLLARAYIGNLYQCQV